MGPKERNSVGLATTTHAESQPSASVLPEPSLPQQPRRQLTTNKKEQQTQKTCVEKATSSASKDLCIMHRVSWRRRCRGTYYKEYVLAYVSGFAERVGCSFSRAVNCLLDKAIGEGFGEVEETVGLQVRKAKLLEEEVSLRETLKVILRSGAYLKDYAKELLLGDFKQISNLKNRVGIFSQVEPRELNVILRILKRREDLVGELLEIEDKLLPSEPYPFMVTEHGWKVGDFHIARDRSGPPKKTGQSKQKNGGMKR